MPFAQDHRGWSVFYVAGDADIGVVTGSFDLTVIHDWYDRNTPSTWGYCEFQYKNIGIRKRVRWSYGPALETPSPYFTTSKEKTFNTEETENQDLQSAEARHAYFIKVGRPQTLFLKKYDLGGKGIKYFEFL